MNMPGNWERLGRASFLLLVLVIAAVLRIWQLDSLPPGLYHDEAYNGLDALSLTQGRSFPQFYEGWEQYAAEAHGDQPAEQTRWPVFFEGNYGREPLHIYLMAAAIKLLGPNVLAIRIVPAIAGIIAVLTTYLAAHELGMRQGESRAGHEQQTKAIERLLLDPPLIAALAMAILFPAVHFSRFGVRAMLFVPLATLTVVFFWRGINETGEARSGILAKLPISAYFVLAGAFLGLALYSYAAARLFPLVFAIFVVYWFWRDRAAMRTHRWHVLAMAGVSFLTALPLLWFFIRYPYYFVFRIAYVANKGRGAVEGRPWLTWIGNIGRVLRGLIVYGETHLRHNLPGRPYMDPVQAWLFMSGIVVTVWQRRRLAWKFLWIWLVVMLLPSIMSGDAPHFGRLTGAAPPVAILISLGWVGIVRALMQRVPSGNAGLVLAVSGIVLLASALWTAADYFVRYAEQPELPDAFYEQDWELGRYLAESGEEVSLYLTPSQEELATIYFALESPDRLTNYTGTSGLVPAGIPSQANLYVIRPSDSDYLDRLAEVFPNGRLEERRETFLSYFVAAENNQVDIEHEVGYRWSEQIALVGWSQHWHDDRLIVTLVWQAISAPDRDYTAYVHLLDESGAIMSQVDRPPTGYATSNWRDGEIVVDQFALNLPSGYAEKGASVSTGFYDPTTKTNLGAEFLLDSATIDAQGSEG